MTSSGTYNFSLSNSSIAEQAFSRIQLRHPAILAEHVADAYAEMNLMMASKFSNLEPNLWKVDLVSTPLIAGTATYAVDAKTTNILDAYISFNNSTTSNRLIFPVSRTEYASYPNPTAQGVPSVFWYDKLINPTITLWFVPDASATYTLNYYRTIQIQDANLTGGETPDIPQRWMDAVVAELSYRMARIWKPEMMQALKVDAQEAWTIAATADVEDVPLSIAPGLDSYFR